MRRLLPAAFALAALLPAGVCAKGEGVGLWMEGTVSEVKAEGQRIRLVLTGRFWFEQHRNQQASVIEVRDLRTGGPASIPATLTQGKMFFAMVENWRGGAIREDRGALLALLQRAAGSSQVLKFELVNARLKFGSIGKLTVESAQVIRATDPKLR
jgi:hypothetical protein